MSIKEKLRQNNVRNCIDVLLAVIPAATIALERINILPEMPKVVNYALVTSAFAGVIDIIYRFGYRDYS
ncbi:MAG: hypothetical protein Q8N63_05770 [Nanoarchaeota archaeon]|nr:hypothetical protein [Nanoarchaeota archaeon]